MHILNYRARSEVNSTVRSIYKATKYCSALKDDDGIREIYSFLVVNSMTEFENDFDPQKHTMYGKITI